MSTRPRNKAFSALLVHYLPSKSGERLQNILGRADELAVDIDLDDQETNDRIWTSKQHARIVGEDGKLFIEDLQSANGTYVNRTRVAPGKKQSIKADDVIQVGTVQLKLKIPN